ncbi:hypothetical protein Rin_00000760 [Candidatus Regiella insecticola 5.15]|uniref:Uncharacterized protein n=1 Tax=Candidatus Regiella insecticola 5.15 TaxID=1005043 RepID=G2GWE2_9ENTR|nr:hypothetical protein [Candidatus Regiella insecticola]EGY29934.1 hypothetical protein Rin_00000760 [Candidatus Regiella insecticola 5.15]
MSVDILSDSAITRRQQSRNLKGEGDIKHGREDVKCMSLMRLNYENNQGTF